MSDTINKIYSFGTETKVQIEGDNVVNGGWRHHSEINTSSDDEETPLCIVEPSEVETSVIAESSVIPESPVVTSSDESSVVNETVKRVTVKPANLNCRCYSKGGF